MVTVSLTFLMEPEADMSFVVPFMYAGILLFYLGLAGSNSYRRDRFRAPVRQLACQAATLVAAFALCVAFADVRWAVVLVTFLLAAGECAVMGVLYRRGRGGPEHGEGAMAA